MDLNVTFGSKLTLMRCLPLREGVDLNAMLLGHTLTQGGLPLREGVDLNVDLWGETEGGKTSPSA